MVQIDCTERHTDTQTEETEERKEIRDQCKMALLLSQQGKTKYVVLLNRNKIFPKLSDK